MPKRISQYTLRALLVGALSFGALQAWAAESPDNPTHQVIPSAAPAKPAPKSQASTRETVRILEEKIAVQQAEIEKLMQAVELLTDRLNAAPQEPKKAEQADARTGSVAQVSGLAPVIPASASIAAKSSAAPSAQPDGSSPASAADKIAMQQKQIEKLQSSLRQQQAELDKRTGAAGDSQAVSASSEGPAQTTPGEARLVLVASSASPSATPPASNPAQSGGSAGKPAAPTFQLPAILKSFHPIGLFYISYQNGTKYAGVPGETADYNAFELKRGYFGADVDITSYFTGRFVTDVTSDSAGDFKPRMKYLYGKFHWKGNQVITSPYMEFGLAHMPWLDFEEAINGFRMQDTMFLERNGIFNSADVGVLFGSDIGGSMSSDYKKKVDPHYAGKYGSWQAGIYNGGGYHAKELNTNKVFEGRITVRPAPDAIPGLQFTAFGLVGKGNVAMNPPDWRAFDGMVSYESERFTFTGQGFVGTGNQSGTAVNADGTAADQKGFSLFGAVHFPLPNHRGKLTVLGRADEMNSNTAVYNDIKRLYIAGVAWAFYKSNTWLFDFQRTNHSFSTIPGENRVQATLQVAF